MPTIGPDAWPGITAMGWEAWDGSSWDLLSGDDGIALSRGGVRGLAMPPIKRYTRSSPGVNGTAYRGHRVDERDVFWPLHVLSDKGSEEWFQKDREFWRTLQPDKTGLWTITQPSGEYRTLRCRYISDGGMTFSEDPALRGWALYGIDLVAEQPFWEGLPISRSFSPSTNSDFYNGASMATPFNISSSSDTATASINNPGDVAVYPIWKVAGPISSATLGVGGSSISIPFALTAGQWVQIDTNPDQLVAVDQGGADRTRDLGSSTFGSIEPGANIPLTISLTGGSTATVVTADITPKYYRAW